MGKFAYGETITRLRGVSATDGYNGTVIDWTSPAELEIEGVGIAPRVEDELHGPGRAGVIVGFTLYCAYDDDIGFQDRIRRTDGTVFELEGEPGPWLNPLSGVAHGKTAALRRVDG